MKPTPKSLHIAIVADAVYPYNIGGKEKRNYEIAKRLAQRGHTVTIYCMKWWKENTQQVIREGIIHEAISPYYPLYANERRSIKQSIMFALHTVKLLQKDFDVIDIDHIPQPVLFPMKLVCLLKGKRMIVTLHEVWGKDYWKQYLGRAGLIAALVERLTIKLPDTIISGSQHSADKLAAEFQITDNVYPIPNGIDLAHMNKIKPARKHTEIVFAGRLLAHKNVDFLIQAVAELKKEYPKLICLIIGNGPEKAKLKKLAKQLGVEKQVTFVDFLKDHDAFYALVKAAKMFVMPSEREGFGIATIEAQSLGVPVITYNHPNNGSRKLIIEGKNGYLFDTTKHPLTQAIQRILKKRPESKTVTDSVKQYDWENITTQIEEVYRS